MTQENKEIESKIEQIQKLTNELNTLNELDDELESSVEKLEEEKEEFVNELIKGFVESLTEEIPLLNLVLKHDDLMKNIDKGKQSDEPDKDGMYVYSFADEEVEIIKKQIEEWYQIYDKAVEQVAFMKEGVEVAKMFVEEELEYVDEDSDKKE